jgi:hypothetical protein
MLGHQCCHAVDVGDNADYGEGYHDDEEHPQPPETTWASGQEAHAAG